MAGAFDRAKQVTENLLNIRDLEITDINGKIVFDAR